ncbi:hypothetical protein OHA91_39580 (plasmid) [Streptomyces erythrochromogenes]|uniref:Uncharacterized protein n=1 Tax=Streptomyces erythrochromogenes TaxID=285574 RepID=A0ABZ1QRA3_9ACTN|nr:hypothetical protein [Streptomyces erythrochromogenes]
MIAFLKEHSTILLALLTVAAAFGGTWLGSHIQAKGGLAQAKAAKEAAETAAAATLQAVREQSDRAAAATHAAAVRDRRTSSIADLLRATRELVRALDRQYREPGNDATMNTLHEAFIQARGTVELCAPTSLLPAVKELAKTTRNLNDLAHERAESNRAMTHLQTLERDGVDATPLYRAVAALETFRTAALADAPNAMELHDQAEEALRQVPQLPEHERVVLLVDCYYEPLRPALSRHRDEHYQAMNDVIEQARSILGVND